MSSAATVDCQVSLSPDFRAAEKEALDLSSHLNNLLLLVFFITTVLMSDHKTYLRLFYQKKND